MICFYFVYVCYSSFVRFCAKSDDFIVLVHFLSVFDQKVGPMGSPWGAFWCFLAETCCALQGAKKSVSWHLGRPSILTICA